MNETRKSIIGIVVALSVVLALTLCVQGCKDKEEPAAQEQAAQSHDHDHGDAGDHTHEHPAGTEHPAATVENVTQTVEAKLAAAGEQTTCPVMGNPINKDLFVEHEGKKIYFCCEPCIATFKADPAKYIAKLPQFQE